MCVNALLGYCGIVLPWVILLAKKLSIVSTQVYEK